LPAGCGLPSGAPFGAAPHRVNEGASCIVEGSMIEGNLGLRGGVGQVRGPGGNLEASRRHAGPAPHDLAGRVLDPLPGKAQTAMLPRLTFGD
jgi:hypothetical protein